MISSSPYLSELQKIILRFIGEHKVKVYLFGSRAKNTARLTSDVDIGLLPFENLPINFVSDLRELIDASNVPYGVDIVDLSQTDSIFREKVLKEGILWND